jgi:hypothetical protein
MQPVAGRIRTIFDYEIAAMAGLMAGQETTVVHLGRIARTRNWRICAGRRWFGASIRSGRRFAKRMNALKKAEVGEELGPKELKRSGSGGRVRARWAWRRVFCAARRRDERIARSERLSMNVRTRAGCIEPARSGAAPCGDYRKGV